MQPIPKEGTCTNSQEDIAEHPQTTSMRQSKGIHVHTTSKDYEHLAKGLRHALVTFSRDSRSIDLDGVLGLCANSKRYSAPGYAVAAKTLCRARARSSNKNFGTAAIAIDQGTRQA